MNIDYSEIEKLYLSTEEIEYIKHTIINPEIKPGSETLKWFSWRENIARTSRQNQETNHKLVEQYERLIEIDYLFTILKGDFSRTILDLNRKMEYCDKQTQEYDVRVMLENTMIEVETCVYEKELEKILIEEYEQDLEDSFVQELIKQLMN